MIETSPPTLRPYVRSDWGNFLALDLETAGPALRGASADVRDRFAARWPGFLRSRHVWTDAGPTTDASLLLVCEVAGVFAGHLWLTEQTDFFTGERQLFVTTIAVAHAFRRRGIGRFLMDAALADARRRGLASVSLGVDADNPNAIALYESLGFRTRRLSMTLATGTGDSPA